jgi:quinol-cytochrome oxidoreductase complex cytochrome b subunit
MRVDDERTDQKRNGNQQMSLFHYQTAHDLRCMGVVLFVWVLVTIRRIDSGRCGRIDAIPGSTEDDFFH